jgi:cytochrome c biogenesis protein CcmG, thiol:disulfide interchange protein DsbE
MQRSIALLIGVAALTTIAVVAIVGMTRPGGDAGTIAKGQPVPNVAGTTLDGQPFDLTSLRGHPVVINFWGPSCVPCQTEFPLLASKAKEHGVDGLVIVGVLTDDPPDLARTFVTDHAATWQTVIDPGAALKASFHVIGRPQSFFVDRAGILRSIQIGEVQDKDFERQYGLISGGS